MIDVRNDGDITNFIHLGKISPARESRQLYERVQPSQTPVSIGRTDFPQKIIASSGLQDQSG